MKKENLEGRINLHIDLFKEIRDIEGDSVTFPEEGIDLDDSGFVRQVNGLNPILSLSNCLEMGFGSSSYVLEIIYHGDISLSNLSQLEFISKAAPEEIKIYNDIWKKRERGN